MRRGWPHLRWWMVAGLLLTVVVAVVVGVAIVGSRSGSAPVPITVMTRNLYLGGDITRPLRAAQDKTGGDALLALGHANRELRGIVARTDFRARSQLLATEIAAARPDLIGLQEVALWRHGPLQLDQLGRPNATEVDDDFLSLLQADLTARQAGYDVVRVQQESDVEAPAFSGDPLTGGAGSAEDVRLTLFDVILVLRGSRLVVTGSGSGQYEHRLDVTLGGLAFSFLRGYVWADVHAGSAHFRFVTTHLESQRGDVALAQAGELLNGPAAAKGPVVVVGDSNSDPTDTALRPGRTVAGAAAYELLTRRGRLADAWVTQPSPHGPGYTAAYSELLDDPTSGALHRRIDLVLTRGTRSAPITVLGAEVTGDQPGERTPGAGLRPSDHAGVVARLQVG